MKRSVFAASLPITVASWRAALGANLEPVSVAYAASLITLMEHDVGPVLRSRGIEFRGEAKGSVELANLIASGLRIPDVFISADPKLMDGLMGDSKAAVTWAVTFATTRLVIGYARESRFAPDFERIARGSMKLTQVLLEPGLRLGRTDPKLDPKGYRSIIAAKLLEAADGTPGFAKSLLGDDRNPAQIVPEETLLARLETGDIDAAFLYATEAVARNVAFVELPASANLGEPSQAQHYATVSVLIDDKRHVGSVAAYALTIPTAAEHQSAADRFVTYLLSADGSALLARNGVTPIRPLVDPNLEAVPGIVRAALHVERE